METYIEIAVFIMAALGFLIIAGAGLVVVLDVWGNKVWQKSLAIYRIESMRYYMTLAEKRGRLGIFRDNQKDLDDAVEAISTDE